MPRHFTISRVVRAATIRLATAGLAACALAAPTFAQVTERQAAPAPRQTAVLIESAPAFLLPDTRRVPLRVLQTGTAIYVLRVEGDWVQIEFQDERFGPRFGYVEKKSLRLSPPPIDEPAPATGVKTALGSRGTPRPEPPAAAVQTVKPTVVRRGYFAVNAGYQPSSNSFSTAWQFTANQETGSAQAAYPVKAGAEFDVAAGVRVWRDLLVGLAVSRYGRAGVAHAAADLPHPFYFDQTRHVEGDLSSLDRRELAVHMQATWMIALPGRMRLALSAGPTVFQLSQPLVTKVDYTDSYPYDSATFSGAATSTQTARKLTFNVGADLSFMLTRQVGLGAAVRFSRATLPLQGADGATLDVKAGGPQIGVGLRLAF